jgi:hypothetical protein
VNYLFLSGWQKLMSWLFYFSDRYHSGLVRVVRWVAVVSLVLAVAAVYVENNSDVGSRQIGLIRENVVGPVFLLSLGLLFALWVRRSANQR